MNCLIKDQSLFQSVTTLASFYCPIINLRLDLLENAPSEIYNDISTVISDCNGAQTHNHLVRKRTLNHLVKLAKSLSCAKSTYLYGKFECMLLSCHVRISE